MVTIGLRLVINTVTLALATVPCRFREEVMPKIVDHDERRSHIADAVVRIIARDGFDRVTMREIASEAGYAHGAIVRYFPNKENLLEAAFVRIYTSAHERVTAAISGLRGLTALEHMCHEILPFAPRGAPSAKVVIAFWDHAAQNEHLRLIHEEHNMRWRAMFRTYLQQSRDDGELAEHVDIETAVNEIAVRNAGWQMTSVLLPLTASDEQIRHGLGALIAAYRRVPATVKV